MKKTVYFIFVFISLHGLFSEQQGESVSFDFVNQDIRDIVYAVSLAQNIPIICDDTVTGNASFRFSGSSFEEATKSFLLANRLFARYVDDIILVSKVLIEKNSSTHGLFEINAYDVAPSVLFNKISEIARIPIIFETLPATPVSVHVEKVKIEEAVSIIMKAFPDYSVTVDEQSIRIAKSAYASFEMPSFTNQNGGSVSITKTSDGIVADITKGSFFESLEKMFSISENLFCNLLVSDRLITRFHFSHDDFENILSKLCSQAEAGFTFYDGMYIIYGIENATDDLARINKIWKTITLKYINAKNFASLFAQRFPTIPLLIISNSRVQMEVTKIESKEVDVFTILCDIPEKTHLVKLQYITTEKLLNHLPPGIYPEQFSDIGSEHSVFFIGSDESYKLLKTSLDVLDYPAVIISYDLLVLQVQESESRSWKPKFSAEHIALGDRTSLTGQLGSVFALNLDVVTAFGYTFAADLQSAIGENKAKVYVDTTLQGISGSPIHFQNTNTFRYQDTAIDSDTGKPVYSGITREIVAGLVLNIEGWVSGDGMVTTKVTASLSRRGADVTENGNPPPTSEKIVTTEVRGKSGQPIVLSGLTQNDSSFVDERTPFLSKIPLLGWLFKSHQKSEEKTEMIIYLVPHVDTIQREVLNEL